MNTAYADRAWQGTVVIAENVEIARNTYRVRIECPRIASLTLPGQFLMLRLPGANDPLLGRPMAVYDVVSDAEGRPVAVDVVYLVVGKMTGRLAHVRGGALLEAWGPLGNGFAALEAEHLVMVAGGIGQTPFLTLAKEYLGQRTYGDPPRRPARADKVTLCYGARSEVYLAGVDDFRRVGVEVRVATDDGSLGHHGPVTELIPPVVDASPVPCRIVCCGPEAMMAATAKLAGELGLACHVSLESPMACGVGICFSCVAKARDHSGNWDYRRVCVEGPVFDARDIEF